MITRAASGRSVGFAPIVCSVAALLSPCAPALAGSGNAQVATCSAASDGVADRAFGERRQGVPQQGCRWLEVPEPLPLALFGIGLVAVALTRRRPPVRIAGGLSADPRPPTHASGDGSLVAHGTPTRGRLARPRRLTMNLHPATVCPVLPTVPFAPAPGSATSGVKRPRLRLGRAVRSHVGASLVAAAALGWPPLADALPLAMTDVGFNVQVRVQGRVPPPGAAGNGIAIVPNPAASAAAGAVSYVRAVGAAGIREAALFSPLPPPEPAASAAARGRGIMWDVFLRNNFAGVPVGNTNAAGVAVATAGPLGVTSAPHIATVAANRLRVDLPPFTRLGGATFNGQVLTTFEVLQKTEARTRAAEPEYADANAMSRGQLNGVTLRNTFAAGAVPAGFAPRLELGWAINQMTLRAEPAFARAFVRHDVVVNGTAYGFQHQVINGVQDSAYFGDDATKRALDGWFTANAGQAANTWRLNPPPRPPLTTNVPLAGALLVAGGELPLTIENRNYAFSFESPPVANGKDKERAGHRPGSSRAPAAPNMHWNAATQTLSFDDVPINTLLRDDGDGVDARYAADPILGAMLHVDPLVYAFDADGRRYFAGGRVTISDGVTDFFSALLPALILDESLFDREGVNLFAPMRDAEIDLGAGSLWLQDYFDRMVGGEPLLPNLFVSLGSRIGGAGDPFATSFDGVAGLDIGFSTPVSEPPFAWATALLALVAWRRRARRR